MTKDSKNSKRKKASNGKGALVLVAGLLLSSAFLRMGESAGQAFALEPPKEEMTGLAPAQSEVLYQTPDDLKPMLEAFQAREAKIEEQEAALRKRMQALRIAEEEIEKNLAALTQAETELRDMIAIAETAAESDLERLTKVYETMKPKQAAALFEEMTPEFAAGFLGRMRPDAAAAIMASLSPEAAHTFSVVLAGRNANVPSE